MRRMILPAVVILALSALGWLLASNPGSASADWLGWRIDTTAALAVVLVVLAALSAAGLWTAVLWLARIPARSARARREQASNLVTRGWLALAAGDAAEARRLGTEAKGLDEGAMPRLLAAQAAEAADDDAAAQAAWAALLERPEAAPAARAGLARLEARRRAREEPAAPPFPEEARLAAEPLSLGA